MSIDDVAANAHINNFGEDVEEEPAAPENRPQEPLDYAKLETLIGRMRTITAKTNPKAPPITKHD